jgi:predicted nucleic acid-binding protein
MPIVSNSSPLIALEQIEKLDLLHELFGEILIPDPVATEIAPTVRTRSWIRQQSLSGTLLLDTLRPALGSGERAAISLAAEVKASTIILDDEPARKIAAKLKIPTMGTAAVLILAKDRQLIAAVKPCLDALIEHRFFLARAVYELILSRTGEL